MRLAFTCRHHDALSEEGVNSMIEGFDRQQIGGVQARRTQAKANGQHLAKVQASDAVSADLTADSDLEEAGPHTHVQVSNAFLLYSHHSLQSS